MRDSEYSYQDEDAPTDAILEKQAQAEVGFTDEDEPGEFQQRLPEEEPARIAPLAEQSSRRKRCPKSRRMRSGTKPEIQFMRPPERR